MTLTERTRFYSWVCSRREPLGKVAQIFMCWVPFLSPNYWRKHLTLFMPKALKFAPKLVLVLDTVFRFGVWN